MNYPSWSLYRMVSASHIYQRCGAAQWLGCVLFTQRSGSGTPVNSVIRGALGVTPTTAAEQVLHGWGVYMFVLAYHGTPIGVRPFL